MRAVYRLQMLRCIWRGVIRKHFLVMIHAWRGEALALGEGTQVEGLGGVLDGHEFEWNGSV